MEQQGGRKTYKYKLMPTPDQERTMATVVWRCRELYNAGLQERKAAWEQCGVSVTFAMQSAQLPRIKEVRPEYRDINAHVLQDVLHRLDKTFQAFFRRVMDGDTPGYPRFQGRNLYTNQLHLSAGRCAWRLRAGRVHPQPLQDWPYPHPTPSPAARHSQDGDHQPGSGWLVCLHLLCGGAGGTAALDRQSDGHRCGPQGLPRQGGWGAGRHPRHHCKAEKGLKTAQRCVSRRKKGSQRWRKAVGQCAKKYQKVKRQRADFRHKTALALVREYDTIYLEDLQIRNLGRRPRPKPDGNGGYAHNGASRKAGLNKSIQDASWYAFRRILTCKAEWAGKRVEAIPPAFTTQECSGCCERIYKSLSVRTHVCTNCGLMLDRDENAALNILREGHSRQALTQSVGAYVA